MIKSEKGRIECSGNGAELFMDIVGAATNAIMLMSRGDKTMQMNMIGDLYSSIIQSVAQSGFNEHGEPCISIKVPSHIAENSGLIQNLRHQPNETNKVIPFDELMRGLNHKDRKNSVPENEDPENPS